MREQDDQLALQTLAAQSAFMPRLHSPRRVKLLWEVCQVPDFRKTMTEEHIQLLGQLFGHLTQGGERLPEDWIDSHVKRLERFDGDIDKWDSLEQFGGTGRGDRADSVRDFHSAMTGRDRAANDFIDAEQREADRGGGDIDDGVNRADLVKVNLFDRRTVDGRFGFGDGGEDAERQIALIVSQDFRTVDDLLNVGQMAVRVLFRMLHTQMLRAKAAAHHVLKMQRDAGEAERVDSRLDRRRRNRVALGRHQTERIHLELLRKHTLRPN